MSRSLCLALGVAVLLGACGNSKIVEKVEGFADQVCACADAACVAKVQAEFQTWAETNRNARGSDDDRKRTEKAMKRFAECVNEKMPAGAAEPAPEAAEPAPEAAEPAPEAAEPDEPAPEPAEPASEPAEPGAKAPAGSPK